MAAGVGPPELGQATMDRLLTNLIRELLEGYQGPLPCLAYVTDSGSNETSYYQKVLRRMVHPRPEKRLTWTRVADYFHASERIWAMAEAAFKTIFTQRLKNSGMRWSHEGAKTILNLRTILLSKTWSPTYAAYLANGYPSELRPYEKSSRSPVKTAA
jgi:hypothetical protein